MEKKENKCCEKCRAKKHKMCLNHDCPCHHSTLEKVKEATEETLEQYGQTFKDLAEYDKSREWEEWLCGELIRAVEEESTEPKRIIAKIKDLLASERERVRAEVLEKVEIVVNYNCDEATWQRIKTALEALLSAK